MPESMQAQQTITIQVSGQGESKQKAVADALGAIQRTVLKGTDHLILRIQPLEVSVVNATVKVNREKFLFLFLPRQRESYSVVLNVKLDVTLLNIQNLYFESVN